MPRRRSFLALLPAAAASLALTGTAVPAQADSRNIALVVPFSAGGAADAVARALAQALTAKLGQTVVVDNRGGAAGLLGATAAANAAADGHTLFLVTDGIFANPVHANARAQSVFARLAPVAGLAEAPLLIATASSFPGDTVQDVLRVAKSRSKPLSYATPGIGTTHHLAGEQFAALAGIRMQAIPYRGTAAAVADLASGIVDLQIGNITSFKSLIEAGKVKLIGVASTTPFSLLPDTPTVASAGPAFKDYEWIAGFGLMTTAGTPSATIERLSRATALALKDAELLREIDAAGLVPAYLDAAQFGRALTEVTAVRTQLAVRLGLTGQ